MGRMGENLPRLSMQGIAKRFGATVALDGVDLEARAGEVLALVGENGAGKSTLMKVLSGALAPDSGSMKLGEEPYAPRSPAEAHARGVAMIYQELSLAPHLTAAENIALGREPVRGLLLDSQALRERARAALERVGHADLPIDIPVARLSPAERQIVEIARALSLGSRVLVLDEPTSSLSSSDVARLLDLLRGLRAQGLAVVYISHVLEEVFAVADRYTVLRDGRSVASGPIAGVDARSLVAHMVGRDVGEIYPRSARSPGDVVARIENLAGVRLPRAASLEIRRGEVLGLAGLVGAGRTELLRALFGLDPVLRGEISVLALRGPASPRARWAQRVGMVSEDRQGEGLALSLSVADNLCLPSLRALSRAGLATPRAVERSAAPWIDRLRVRCRSPREQVALLSGGNQQKVALARLLAADCDILLLDEPTRGIDVAAKAEIYALIDELARAGRAVLLVSSYLPELLGLCDRIAVMSRGRLGPARPAADLDAHGILLAATGGEAA
jgi:ribose transport system ATP-binding protein